MEVLEGNIDILKEIVKFKTEIEDDQDFDKAAEYGFSLDDDNLKIIKSWPEKSIGKIKDQVLAWKVINYLCFSCNIIKPDRTSSWRTNWKKVCAVHQLRQFESEKVYNGTVVKNKASMETNDQKKQKELDALFNYDRQRQLQEEAITAMEKEREDTYKQILDLQAKLSKLDMELPFYKSVYEGIPQEHTAGGGVDQGERSEDEVEESNEYGEAVIHYAPEPKKKGGGRKPKTKVAEMVETLEGKVGEQSEGGN